MVFQYGFKETIETYIFMNSVLNIGSLCLELGKSFVCIESLGEVVAVEFVSSSYLLPSWVCNHQYEHWQPLFYRLGVINKTLP